MLNDNIYLILFTNVVSTQVWNICLSKQFCMCIHSYYWYVLLCSCKLGINSSVMDKVWFHGVQIEMTQFPFSCMRDLYFIDLKCVKLFVRHEIHKEKGLKSCINWECVIKMNILACNIFLTFQTFKIGFGWKEKTSQLYFSGLI